MSSTTDHTVKAPRLDWARVNVTAFMFNFAVVAAGRLSLMGKNNRAVSNAHPTLVTPSGWAMIVWVVVFLLETVFTVWQVRAAGGRSPAVTKGVGPWFAAACVFQALWNIAFAQEFIVLSAVLVCGIAACLTTAAIRLAPYKESGGVTVLSWEYWVLHFPLGLHAGWTSVASLVLINMTLEAQDVSCRVAALMVTFVAASLAAVFMASVFNDQAYLCAVAWAMKAIAGKPEPRRQVLPLAVADGVGLAFSVMWVALLVFGALAVVGSKIARRRRGGRRRRSMMRAGTKEADRTTKKEE